MGAEGMGPLFLSLWLGFKIMATAATAVLLEIYSYRVDQRHVGFVFLSPALRRAPLASFRGTF